MNKITAQLRRIREEALREAGTLASAQQVTAFRVRYLGRKSALTKILRSLRQLPLAQRKEVGKAAQALRREIEELVASLLARVDDLAEHAVDLTAPGKRHEVGRLHPLTKVRNEICSIFWGLNFSVVEGNEVETEYYNFDALNIPPDHPARDAWDTFWIRQKGTAKNRLVLRTHTSPVQIRYMEQHTPPFQIISPGRVFRYEATDASHEVNFYQVEGLMVGKEVNLEHFKFITEAFLKKFFGARVRFRFRPSYFPFVEPGLEVDIQFGASGPWLEVMGAGMVHPRVFEYVHYNPRDWQGFAFGMGLDRLAMLKYRIPDIRMLYSGDLRLVKQFR
ncbi:phenylalanine--tRNA ligase subunit alpha [Candidatus Parcubacteria bacterium]|nr:MAG: phenylalanine--tRNA ligase subunit alpha [Candidatus Parcubacteria bacterium]